MPNRSYSGRALRSNWGPARLDYVDAPALLATNIGAGTYGHFLYDGLPSAWLLAGVLKHCAGLVIATQKLNRWQREIFALLKLDHMIREMTQATRYRTLIGSSLLAHHTNHPTRYVRALFDALKFAVPSDNDAPEKVLIVRASPNHREMRNVDGLKAIATRRGYHVVQPELYPIREQIRVFSRARIIVGETGSALANVGFASPGARILEIMPECYPDGFTRTAAVILGHHWHVYLCKVREEDMYGVQVGNRFHKRSAFGFDLPLDDFEASLEAVERS